MQVDMMLSNDSSDRRSAASHHGGKQPGFGGQNAGQDRSNERQMARFGGVPTTPIRTPEASGGHGGPGGYSGVLASPLSMHAEPSNMVFPTNKKAKEGGSSSLRTFGQSVCRQLEKSRITTYNDVANSLVDEYRHGPDAAPTREAQQADEKNIRRRTYDALNVLVALDIVERKNKTLRWVGLPESCNALKGGSSEALSGAEEARLLAQIRAKQQEVERKKSMAEVLTGHFRHREALVKRHDIIPDVPADRRVSLPFVLAGVSEGAEVDLTMSEDKQEAQMSSTHQFVLQDDRDALALLARNGRLKRPISARECAGGRERPRKHGRWEGGREGGMEHNGEKDLVLVGGEGEKDAVVGAEGEKERGEAEGGMIPPAPPEEIEVEEGKLKEIESEAEVAGEEHGGPNHQSLQPSAPPQEVEERRREEDMEVEVSGSEEIEEEAEAKGEEKSTEGTDYGKKEGARGVAERGGKEEVDGHGEGDGEVKNQTCRVEGAEQAGPGEETDDESGGAMTVESSSEQVRARDVESNCEQVGTQEGVRLGRQGEKEEDGEKKEDEQAKEEEMAVESSTEQVGKEGAEGECGKDEGGKERKDEEGKEEMAVESRTEQVGNEEGKEGSEKVENEEGVKEGKDEEGKGEAMAVESSTEQVGKEVGKEGSEKVKKEEGGKEGKDEEGKGEEMAVESSSEQGGARGVVSSPEQVGKEAGKESPTPDRGEEKEKKDEEGKGVASE